MQAKTQAGEEIDRVLAALVQAGIINEQRFTENYIYWRRNKGYGPKRIAIELQARGIPAEMIAEQLEITDNAWFAEARKLWQKRFKGIQPSDFKSRAKQIRFLLYRGFTEAHITAVILNNE